MTSKMKHFLLASFACLSVPATAAQVGEWTYLLTPGNIGREVSKVGLRNGHNYGQAQLFKEDDGTYLFRLQGVTADECLNTKIPAVVETQEGDLIITPSKRFASCPSLRLVIKIDGSGGVVQQLVGRTSSQSWVTDEGHEYGLKAR